jgi:hypothetical protein
MFQELFTMLVVVAAVLIFQLLDQVDLAVAVLATSKQVQSLVVLEQLIQVAAVEVYGIHLTPTLAVQVS